ncbi:MAG: class I SAM-dependent methyltransferase [Chloroflexota bacterium]|nr:class I SAM-dependent methyltransferase [Chloroflexota bacterium]
MLTIDYGLLGIKDGDRVLDIGCGEGRHSWEACKRSACAVYALDIEEGNLKKAKSIFELIDEKEESNGTWNLIRGDAMTLPFKDVSFDKIICSEVLEHVTDDRQSITEIVRVLKNDGVIAISVPAYLPETICWKLSEDYHNTPGGHVRIYKTNELISKLRQSNLNIRHTRRKHALHTFYWISRCLFGIKNEKSLIPFVYHKFLVWDIKTKSKPIRLLESLLNYFFPKSVVFYASKNYQKSKEA